MRTGLFVVLVLFAALWTSCEKENPVEKQEERIDAYIKAKMNKNPDLKLSNGNNVRYLYTPGDTDVSVATGDSVYFYYSGTLFADTLKYFDTNIKALAEDLKLNTESRTFEPMGIIVGNNNLVPGLAIGLSMVHLADKGEIIFNSDMGYGKSGNGVVPPYSPLIFKIDVIKIKK